LLARLSHLSLPRLLSQKQQQQQGLRPDSIILMGKNTMMKRSIKLYCEESGDDTWLPMYEQLVGNVGIVFTKADVSQVGKSRRGARARAPLFSLFGARRRSFPPPSPVVCSGALVPGPCPAGSGDRHMKRPTKSSSS